MRIAKSVSMALAFYLLYYICHIIAKLTVPLKSPVILTVIGSVMFTLSVILVMYVTKKRAADELNLKRLPLAECFGLFLLGASFNVCCTVIISLIRFPKELVESYTEASSEITSAHIIWTAALTLIIAPIAEELLYRGLLYGNLRKAFHPILAGILSAIVFGLAHTSPIWILYAAFLGFVLAFVFEKYGSLTASVIFHFGFNLIGFIMGEFRISSGVVLTLFIPCAVYIVFMLNRIVLRHQK